MAAMYGVTPVDFVPVPDRCGGLQTRTPLRAAAQRPPQQQGSSSPPPLPAGPRCCRRAKPPSCDHLPPRALPPAAATATKT
jgi:hypothetical protein